MKWRRDGSIPIGAFIDDRRWHYGTVGENDAVAYMRASCRGYRLNLWQTQPHYVEVWVEKEAVASIVKPIADEWTLLTFVCRGDASISSMYDAAQNFEYYRRRGRMPVVIYLGDYDQTGIDIPIVLKRNLLRDHGCNVDFIRAGITQEQIFRLGLPTRPTKADNGRGNAVDFACEVDALTPAQMREIVSAEIEKLVNADELKRLRTIEEAEIESLKGIADKILPSIQQVWEKGGAA